MHFWSCLVILLQNENNVCSLQEPSSSDSPKIIEIANIGIFDFLSVFFD